MTGWQDIRAEVLTRIRRRDWLPGALIPAEEQLAADFGVARATVNRALADLARVGVLERRRKAGTRVAALPIRRATLDIPVIRAEIEAQGRKPAHLILLDDSAPLPASVAARLGERPGTTYRHLRTLYLADGRPWCLETRWLNPRLLPDPAPDFTAVSANEWLVGHISLTTGDIAFSAETAGPVEARLLDCAEGAALFITDRTTFAEAEPITAVRLAHAPGYRKLTAI